MGTPPAQEPDEIGPEMQEHGVDRDIQKFVEEISIKERRKLRARRSRAESIWFGLGTFGIIGWSVVVPTVIGILLGLWLDATYSTRSSWTVALLFAGLALGCLNAWYWVSREREMIERSRRNGNHNG